MAAELNHKDAFHDNISKITTDFQEELQKLRRQSSVPWRRRLQSTTQWVTEVMQRIQNKMKEETQEEDAGWAGSAHRNGGGGGDTGALDGTELMGGNLTDGTNRTKVGSSNTTSLTTHAKGGQCLCALIEVAVISVQLGPTLVSNWDRRGHRGRGDGYTPQHKRSSKLSQKERLMISLNKQYNASLVHERPRTSVIAHRGIFKPADYATNDGYIPFALLRRHPPVRVLSLHLAPDPFHSGEKQLRCITVSGSSLLAGSAGSDRYREESLYASPHEKVLHLCDHLTLQTTTQVLSVQESQKPQAGSRAQLLHGAAARA
jgi:hypothetical protein